MVCIQVAMVQKNLLYHADAKQDVSTNAALQCKAPLAAEVGVGRQRITPPETAKPNPAAQFVNIISPTLKVNLPLFRAHQLLPTLLSQRCGLSIPRHLDPERHP
jgi:hypothetical protein